MKKNLSFKIFFLLLVFSCSSYAWKSKDAENKEYTFKYKFSGETLEIKRAASSYEDAYESAAKQCFHHFKGKTPLSENRGLDIIDICANPRS